jgi:hypothetical protein
MLFWIAGSVCLARELLMDLRQIVLTVGILNMCQELSPFAHEMYSAPKQVARGPHLGRIDIRLRQHPAAQEHSDLAVLIQDEEVHGAGVQVDATIKLVLLGVESHEVSSSS